MKKYFYLLFYLVFVNQTFAQFGQRFSVLNKYKICIGAGTGIYWGAGRLYSLPKTGNPSEVTAAYSVAAFKTYSNRFELGFRYNHADLKGQRFGRTWGYTTIFTTTLDDIGFQTNISLNNNLFLRDEFYTFNLIAGIGAAYYKAVMVYQGTDQIRGSIGIGRNELNNIPEKQFAAFGILGLGVHFRVSQLISIGIDNIVNVTTTKSLTGLTQTSTVKVYDSYSVHLLTIGLRLGKGNKLFCSRL